MVGGLQGLSSRGGKDIKISYLLHACREGEEKSIYSYTHGIPTPGIVVTDRYKVGKKE